MSRDLVIAIFASILLHGGLAVSGYFGHDEPASAPAEPEIPTIAIQLPPPEPDEPEIVDNTIDAPAEVADLAPPMQNDLPSAVVDSPFVQQIQPPPPPGLNLPAGIVIPAGTRPAITAGSGLKNIFNLGDLDEPPKLTFKVNPIYPFEMRRSGLKGEVVVEFIVDTDGNVRDPVAIRSSNPAFEDAAVQAVLKWKFKPGKKAGVARNTRVRQPLGFNFNE